MSIWLSGLNNTLEGVTSTNITTDPTMYFDPEYNNSSDFYVFDGSTPASVTLTLDSVNTIPSGTIIIRTIFFDIAATGKALTISNSIAGYTLEWVTSDGLAPTIPSTTDGRLALVFVVMGSTGKIYAFSSVVYGA